MNTTLRTLKSVFIDVPRQTEEDWLFWYVILFASIAMQYFFLAPLRFDAPSLASAEIKNGIVEIVSGRPKKWDVSFVRLGPVPGDVGSKRNLDFNLGYGLTPLGLRFDSKQLDHLDGKNGRVWVASDGGVLQIEVNGHLLYPYEAYLQAVRRTKLTAKWLPAIPALVFIFVVVRQGYRYRRFREQGK